MNATYEDFLRAKVRVAEISGPAIEVDELNPALKPFTQDIVRWAVRGGCRAIFSAFGLHKTATQLEIMRVMGPCSRVLRCQTKFSSTSSSCRWEARRRFRKHSTTA